MCAKPTRSFLDLALACIILAKYHDGSHPLMPPEDIIYTKVSPDELTPEDRKMLDQLGWHVDGELHVMAWRTGRFCD